MSEYIPLAIFGIVLVVAFILIGVFGRSEGHGDWGGRRGRGARSVFLPWGGGGGNDHGGGGGGDGDGGGGD